jgi:hypothetical protein
VSPEQTGANDAGPSVLISLAGVLFVSWPLSDCSPGEWVEVEEATS